MARPPKATVDYFPHVAASGKTEYLLESRWKNDGYATWYKTLERIAASDGHFIDLRNHAAVLYTAAYCGVTPETLMEIYDLLAQIDAIDGDLWQHKIVYSENFVTNISDAYRKRINSLPTKRKILLRLGLLPAAETPFPAAETSLNQETSARNGEREKEREREREKSKTGLECKNKNNKNQIKKMEITHYGKSNAKPASTQRSGPAGNDYGYGRHRPGYFHDKPDPDWAT